MVSRNIFAVRILLLLPPKDKKGLIITVVYISKPMSDKASSTHDLSSHDYEIYDIYHQPGSGKIENDNAANSSSIESSERNSKLPYQSWCKDNGASISEEEIRKIFEKIGYTFGFQKDNIRNMYELFMSQLNSRSGRMSCPVALMSLHADYIGGNHSNFKKWYFAAKFEIDENVTNNNISNKFKTNTKENILKGSFYSIDDLVDQNSPLGQEYKWKLKMSKLTPMDYITHLSLYLLIWGEANNIRFMPECICFIFSICLDYLECGEILTDDVVSQYYFLDTVITPIYNYIRNQRFVLIDGEWRKNTKDHADLIGYDDANQLFWFLKGLRSIELYDGSLFMDKPNVERYKCFSLINWDKVFFKTYSEKRTWIHLFTNFSRVWIIHIVMFWYYNCFNSPTLYTKNYVQLLDNQPPLQVKFSAMSFGGFISCLLTIFALISEWFFVPRKFPGSQPILLRLILTILVSLLNIGPSVYIFGFLPLDTYSKLGTIIAVAQFIVSLVTFLYFAIEKPSNLFSILLREDKNFAKAKVFTSSFPDLGFRSRLFSYLLWICVFLAKFFESYFFLTLSLKDPIRVLSIMDISRCHGDILLSWIGYFICKNQAKFTLVLLYIANLILFFLDTYLWYVICNCIFSVGLTFSLGTSIFKPWKNIFLRLPERLSTKIIYTNSEGKKSSLRGIALIWNAIIVSMYREHLISIEQVNKLVYQFATTPNLDESYIRPPLFFVYQDDNSINLDYFFKSEKDAKRRISFFAQSLSCPIQEPIPIEAMPSFTVLVPHYSEKIILNLREIIREGSNSKVSLLEYLKNLHPHDWDSFVKDTKILQYLSADYMSSNDYGYSQVENEIAQDYIKRGIDDIPIYCVGFKDSSPQFTLRTRLWSSLRYQTLFRTISGFMNYETAIKLLYRVECIENDPNINISENELELELSRSAMRKFNLLVSMQRFQNFSESEKEAAGILFDSYPHIRVSYLEQCNEGEEKTYYSSLLDVSKKEIEGNYRRVFRIKLSGNPILGDGKSDNQNSALIFYRGEYIQVIDANQDNYIEECLKIKAVLSEFQDNEIDRSSEYIPGTITENSKPPVAIIGAREYIFSENIGVLGDIAAGKEQTFGTLFSRTLAEIGGKLHYGHPDFLNGIFMTTRGGISKAQKGLHLNEDIYAGITAICRGGRIKHCDFYQCGKGRDLGFGTILNFTAKIGAGMGEQILSREYFYLGTQLPIDRFLSFYYAHVGFHINNLFIMLSVHLFMIILVNLGSLKHESIICEYDSNVPYTELELPLGCYNLQPVLNWVTRFILSVFICFFISFLPLLIQELIEKGVAKALRRVFFHFISLAPLFEVFVCQVYAKCLRENISYGGAKYIATGRGFATSRVSFAQLYTRYANTSIYSGFMIFLIVIFATLSMWQPSLLWFWITFVSMCLSPFIFNPHQFSFSDFFLDYREFVRWFFRGNSQSNIDSWVNFIRSNRSKFTGYKRKDIGEEAKNNELVGRPSRFGNLINLILIPTILTACFYIPYVFINSQNGVTRPKPVSPTIRLLIISCMPIFGNIVVLLILFVFSSILGPLFGFCCKKTPSIIAALAHIAAVFLHIINFEFLLALEGFNFTRTICGYICVLSLHRTMLRIVLILFLSKELKSGYSNKSWWSGKWISRGIGWLILTQPLREFIVKIIELNLFAYDFILGHLLLFSLSPFLLIPYIDKWHSCMLFWLKPSRQFRGPIYATRQRRKRQFRILRYSILFFATMLIFISLILIPYLIKDNIPDLNKILPRILSPLLQPNNQDNDDTGDNAPGYILRSKPETSI